MVRCKQMDRLNVGRACGESHSAQLTRAEHWLSGAAAKIEWVPDQEALVYLRSRGTDCHTEIAALIESWKTAEEQSLAAPKGRYADTAGSLSLEETSTVFLRDFWDAPP